jgi:PleD family two-component response regulator
MQSRTDVMIIDTDHTRAKSLRRILRQGRPSIEVEECTDCGQALQRVRDRRPSLVFLHSTCPYGDDGRSLVEQIREDSWSSKVGIMMVLPISGSALYRSGYQEGAEVLDLADDLITTDFTSDMVQGLAYEYLDRRAVAEKAWAAEAEGATEPGYAFISKSV